MTRLARLFVYLIGLGLLTLLVDCGGGDDPATSTPKFTFKVMDLSGKIVAP